MVIQNVVKFELGEIGDDIAMSLAYATSQEKLDRREFETYIVGMTRDKAKELGTALLKLAEQPPSGRKPTTFN